MNEGECVRPSPNNCFLNQWLAQGTKAMSIFSQGQALEQIMIHPRSRHRVSLLIYLRAYILKYLLWWTPEILDSTKACIYHNC